MIIAHITKYLVPIPSLKSKLPDSSRKIYVADIILIKKMTHPAISMRRAQEPVHKVGTFGFIVTISTEEVNSLWWFMSEVFNCVAPYLCRARALSIASAIISAYDRHNSLISARLCSAILMPNHCLFFAVGWLSNLRFWSLRNKLL